MRYLNEMEAGYRAVFNQAAQDAFPILLGAFCENQDITQDDMEWAAEYAFIAAKYFADYYMGNNYVETSS
jgi:hypothetical protein